MWLTPCLLPQFVYGVEIITAFGLLFAKSATLMLLQQVFDVHPTGSMRWAIRAGHLVNALVYLVSIAVWSYYSAPHAGGRGWDDVVGEAVRDPDDLAGFHYAVGQAPVVLLLDLYILALPLPSILGLRLSARKRLRLVAIFGVGAL